MRRSVFALAFAASLLVLPTAAAARWQPGFHLNGLSGPANDALVYDDGTGPALYLGGEMLTADDVVVNYLARWDGTRMSAVGGGFDGPIHALAAFDDGSGRALYAAGDFTLAGGQPAVDIARWDGAAWEPVTSQHFFSWAIYDLHVWDDGDGPALYAAGHLSVEIEIKPNTFVNALGVAAWNGESWESLHFGLKHPQAEEEGRALMDFDDGSGSALYVGGKFDKVANGEFPNQQIATSNVGRWDGELWSAVGAGTPKPVVALEAFDFGSGPRLIAGSPVDFTAPQTPSDVVQWNGSSWSQVGSGLVGGIHDFQVFDDGGGAKLYASGDFGALGTSGTPCRRLARWEGGDWLQVGLGLDADARAMAVVDFGPTPGLYIGGGFARIGTSTIALGLARWNGSALVPVTGAAQGLGAAGQVYELAGRAGAFGGKLFAGGGFRTIGPLATRGAVGLRGSQWSLLGNGVLTSDTTGITQLAVFGSGEEAELILAGTFSVIGQSAIANFARWDGVTWQQMAEIEGFDDVDSLLATELAAPAGLDGPRLWVGGDFSTLDAVAATNVASWDGAAFSPLGAGVGTPANTSPVRTFAVFDDGNGPALYAAGSFATAGGIPATRFARWDGSVWSAVGVGFNSAVTQLLVHDDGSGPALYAAGFFTQVDGQAISGLARWDGQTWSSVGGAHFTTTQFGNEIHALASFDDGSGPKLAIGGLFQGPPGPGNHYLVFWDGKSFSAPAGGEPDARVRALHVHDAGNGQTLYVGGAFQRAGGLVSSRIAAYRLSLLFADGFESGDTSAWFSATP